MRRAFTLIELLVVIAIIAILAAILFPVFAQAKQAAKVTTSLSGLKQVSLGLHIYSADYDDMVAMEYGHAVPPLGLYQSNTTWVAATLPYVKNRSIYFDKTFPEPRDLDALYQDPYYPTPTYRYSWSWITTFSMNTDGYSRATSSNNPCTAAPNDGSGSAARSMSSIENTSERLAITPTRYGSIPNWSWMRFLAVSASQPIADRYADTFSWNALVFDSRRQYGNRFIGGMADGSARKFGPEKFVKRYADNPGRNEMSDTASWCAVMESRNLFPFWGQPWSSN